MMFVINPGTGPVVGSSEKNAIENMKHFMVDACPDAKFVRVVDQDKEEENDDKADLSDYVDEGA